MKGNNMGSACSMNTKDEKYVHDTRPEIRIILKYAPMDQNVRTALI
jgi:hypothetical protein